MESREQFIERVFERFEKESKDYMVQHYCAVPCNCEDGGGHGHWAKVPKSCVYDYEPGGIYHDPDRWKPEYAMTLDWVKIPSIGTIDID